jgi:hypothetical protein
MESRGRARELNLTVLLTILIFCTPAAEKTIHLQTKNFERKGK